MITTLNGEEKDLDELYKHATHSSAACNML